jgi:U6 snRNA-associated Sm-like protein LSm1
MENLSIQDHVPPPTGGASNSNALGPAAVPAVQGAPQLPPQMFTTAAQLLDLTDSKEFNVLL